MTMMVLRTLLLQFPLLRVPPQLLQQMTMTLMMILAAASWENVLDYGCGDGL